MQEKNRILDLRGAPTFHESIGNQGILPHSSPRLLDGLSRAKSNHESAKRKFRWSLLMLVILIAITGLATVATTKIHPLLIQQPAPQKAAIAPSSPQILYVTAEIGLKIYAANDSSSPVVTVANFNTPLTIVRNVDSTWVQVKTDSFQGYTVRQYLSDTPVK